MTGGGSVARTPVYQGQVVDLGIETVRLPDGRSFTLEIVRHPGGAATVALDREDHVWLLRQYRHAAGGWIWEVPAGKIDPGEAPENTARRELAEEAGVAAGLWTALGSIHTTPGFCDEVIHLYLARELHAVAPRTEAHESIEAHRVPFTQALEWARSGTIRDAKTLAALFRAAPWAGH